MTPAHPEHVNGPEGTNNLQSGRVEIVVAYNEPETLRNVFLASRGLDTAQLVLIDNRLPSRGLPELFNLHKASSPAEWIVFAIKTSLFGRRDGSTEFGGYPPMPAMAP